MSDTATFGADAVLRYAFSQGPGRDVVAPLGPPERRLTTSFGSLPPRAATDAAFALAWGTVDLLEDTPYPQRCAALGPSTEERIHHALVMAFGLQRREPSNLFNDHRSYASVRSRFPVHPFLYTARSAWFVDVYRHGLLPIGTADPTRPRPGPRHIALAGRYTHLPSLYGRLRGPLVELELGMSLRNLWAALEVFGLSAELQLPGPEAGRLMAHLGLDPASEWSAPLTVAVTEREVGATAAPPAPRATAAPPAPRATAAPPAPRATGSPPAPRATGDDDPTLGEVVAVNRTALDLATAHPPEWSRGGASGLPTGVTTGGSTWSEVLWRRSAGRMPRHLAGVSGRRRQVSTAAVTDALAWLDVAPPTPMLREAARHITVSVCLQAADGFADGWYRLTPFGDRPAGLELLRPDPSLPARLEKCYGHGLLPDVGCAVRHANLTWLLSADVAALVEAIGPGGWTLAQYASGWMAHGLCLAAAAHDLYARPNRAFDEVLLHPIVGMRPRESVLLSVVSGAGRFHEPMLDLRT